MIILSAFNKGGVGKTILAVHVAGLLAEKWRVKKHPKEFSDALREGEFVWNYVGCRYILEILQNATSIQG